MSPITIEDLNCAFCFDKKPRWIYGAHPFRLDLERSGSNLTMSFDQDWLCCNECGFLIDMDMREKLTERSMKVAPDDYIPKDLRAAIHIGFMEARTGLFARLY